ncbi:zinc finger, MYM-type [Branchiostoma belcheri]|nr:zinc finger, MYM-type [Branchiostoma belcheri]
MIEYSEYVVHKDSLGLYKLSTTDAATITAAIRITLLPTGSPLHLCWGQAYDGAGNMKGHRSGVTMWRSLRYPTSHEERVETIKQHFVLEIDAPRLNAEHHAAVERIGMKDKKGMEWAMKKAMQAIPSCYAGDHSQCHKDSLACRHPCESSRRRVRRLGDFYVRTAMTDRRHHEDETRTGHAGKDEACGRHQ